jgi:hypothetical protein
VQKAHLAEHEVALRELDEHLFGAERVVELQFEVFNLLVGISKLDVG